MTACQRTKYFICLGIVLGEGVTSVVGSGQVCGGEWWQGGSRSENEASMAVQVVCFFFPIKLFPY